MPPKEILFLANSENQSTDNLSRLENAFQKAGWQTYCSHHHALWQEDNQLSIKTELNCDSLNLVDLDLIWLLGFGPRMTFLDRMQLLATLPPTLFVNSIQSCLHLQNKSVYAFTSLARHLPKSIGGADLDRLINVIEGGGQWIAKPPAGSFGRDIYQLNRQDPNLHSILEQLLSKGYVLLQEAVHTSNEKRWMLINGHVLGVYAKDKSHFRGNLNAGSQPRLTEPTPLELDQVKSIGQSLVAEGIRFCAIDVAYPYLLDINFINPGWFQSMETLTGRDLSLEIPQLLSP